MINKIKIALLSIICLATFSCSSEETNPMAENLQLIDFTSDEPYAQQTLVIQVAAKRLDKYVHYKNGQFELDYCTPEMVGLSETVFDYMQTLMKRQNEIIHEYDHLPLVDGKKFVYYGKKNRVPRLRTRVEGQTGGVTKIEYEIHWYGIVVDIYISNQGLKTAETVQAVANVLSQTIPEPTISKAIAISCGLASIVCNQLIDIYPNGVIISILYQPSLPATGCVPCDFKGQ